MPVMNENEATRGRQGDNTFRGFLEYDSCLIERKDTTKNRFDEPATNKSPHMPAMTAGVGSGGRQCDSIGKGHVKIYTSNDCV